MVEFDSIVQAMTPEVQEENAKPVKIVKKKKVGVNFFFYFQKKKNVIECCSFSYIGNIDQKKVIEAFKGQGFKSVEF